MNDPIEAALRRHRAVSLAALALLVMLAWAWLIVGAGMGMDPLVSLTPRSVEAGPAMAMPMDMGMAPALAPAPAWPAARFALTLTMWWIMMVAMMVPSAAPTILLYARAAVGGPTAVRPATASFLTGYLGVWGVFALLATVLQMLFERSGLLAPMLMTSSSRWLSGGVLVAAGLYQLSPLKNACLSHCRNPAQFLSRHFRPGSVGALRMGLLHGAWCVGCCWLLMALLFVGGVMNLAWIALLTLMVAAEKLLPFGRWIGRAAGVACLMWGGVMLLG